MVVRKKDHLRGQKSGVDRAHIQPFLLPLWHSIKKKKISDRDDSIIKRTRTTET